MAAINTTDIGGRGKSTTTAGANVYSNPFKGLIEEVPARAVDTTVIAEVKDSTLTVTPEGGHKLVDNKVEVLTIIPSKGAAVRHLTEEALITLGRDGEDPADTLYRLTQERSASEVARFMEALTVAALDAKATAETTVAIDDTANVFASVAEAVGTIEAEGELALAISRRLANRLLSAVAADGRPVIRSLDEIPGVDTVVVFRGAGENGYLFDPAKVKAAIFHDLEGVRMVTGAITLEDGTVRTLDDHNEHAAVNEYAAGVAVGGTNTVAKLTYTPTEA